MNSDIQSFLKSAELAILGKEKEIKLALCCFFTEGHLLIEDVPGLGKTTFAKTLAKLLDLSFSRIQFTNDLMPADLLGIQIYDSLEKKFNLVPGPIFHHFVLADELNRGTPKTQSALLEAMEEKQVTLDGFTKELPKPFFVVATQNPRNQIGTHHLPESQLDRFMMKMKLGYPAELHERKIISTDHHLNQFEQLKPLLDKNSHFEISALIKNVKVSDRLLDYVMLLLAASRNDTSYQGLSPRAGRDAIKAAKAWAFIHGRDFVLPDDIQIVIPYIFSHRLSPLQNQSLDQEINLCHKLMLSSRVD